MHDDKEYWQGRSGLPYTGGDLGSYKLGESQRPWPDQGPSGGDSGSEFKVLLLLAGLVVFVPAAVMALPATPLLKIAAVGTGASGRLPWRSGLLVCVVGSMWYLGLTAALFVGLEAFVRHGLVFAFDPFDGMVAWQQWLVAAWWSGVALLVWLPALWSPSLGGVFFRGLPLAPAALPTVMAAAAMLHLPGLVAYAVVLRRARVTPAGVAGFAVALGLAALLVIASLPVVLGLCAVIIGAVA